MQPYSLKSYHIDELKSLTRYRSTIVSDRTDLKISVKRLINILFPEYDDMFSDIHGAASYSVLHEFPGKDQIAKADIRRLTNIIQKESGGYHGREKAEQIRNLARESIGATNLAQSMELRQTIERIDYLTELIDELEKEISKKAKNIDTPIATIPGIGKTLASSIISEVGDMKRFKNADKLVAYAGLSPSTYQSGQYTAPNARMEKRGSRQLRCSVMLAAEFASRYSDYFARQYAQKRAEGKSYRVAVSHVARNLLRLIYRMEMTGESYHAPSLT